MLVSRRNLLRSMLAAPVIIAADKLMKVQKVLLPEPKFHMMKPGVYVSEVREARVLQLHVSGMGNGVLDVGIMDPTGKDKFLLARQVVMENGRVELTHDLVLQSGDQLYAKVSDGAHGIATVSEYMRVSSEQFPHRQMSYLTGGKTRIA